MLTLEQARQQGWGGGQQKTRPTARASLNVGKDTGEPPKVEPTPAETPNPWVYRDAPGVTGHRIVCQAPSGVDKQHFLDYLNQYREP